MLLMTPQLAFLANSLHRDTPAPAEPRLDSSVSAKLGCVSPHLWKWARNSVLPPAAPFSGDSMQPEDVKPAATMPAVTLSMTF